MDLTDKIAVKCDYQDCDNHTDMLTAERDERLEQAADDLQYAIRWFFHMWASRGTDYSEEHRWKSRANRWDTKKEWRENLDGTRFPSSDPWDWEHVYPWWKWPHWSERRFWRDDYMGTAWLLKRWFWGDGAVHIPLGLLLRCVIGAFVAILRGTRKDNP